MLYNAGTEVASLTFNATGTDKLSWFSQENLVQSPWTDLKTATDLQTFSINDALRIFEISGPYTGCSTDYGWILIIEAICPWETRLPQASILYSKLDTFVNWNQYGMKIVFNVEYKRTDIIDLKSSRYFRALGGGRNRIGRREKWHKKIWEEGEIGGKSREEGEKET